MKILERALADVHAAVNKTVINPSWERFQIPTHIVGVYAAVSVETPHGESLLLAQTVEDIREGAGGCEKLLLIDDRADDKGRWLMCIE